MDNETMLPMNWKPLREAAVLAAEEVQTLYRRNDPARRDIASGVAGRSAVAMEVVAAHAALLANLTRPASRDFWVRWLAEKVGLTVGATAPGWYCHAAAGRTHWQIGDFPMSQNVWVVDHAAEWNKGTRIVVPSISTLTDPAAALRAALLAVEPA